MKGTSDMEVPFLSLLPPEVDYMRKFSCIKGAVHRDAASPLTRKVLPQVLLAGGRREVRSVFEVKLI